MNKVKRFILDWIWQLPQNICGIIYKNFILTSKLNKDDNYNIYLKLGKGSVSLGKYVFIDYHYRNNTRVIQHELGHYKQSKILGPLYLIVIGIPSIIHALLHKKVCKNINYYHFYTEKWANKLAKLKIK